MATPRVSLQSKTVKGKTVFHLDHRANGKWLRPKAGTTERDAELMSPIQQSFAAQASRSRWAMEGNISS
jgi:hypothetical protein